MATVIIAGNSDGTHGRCDDKCHSAKEPECNCICGGLYHGAKAQGGDAELNRRQQEAGIALLEELAQEGKIRPAQGMLL